MLIVLREYPGVHFEHVAHDEHTSQLSKQLNKHLVASLLNTYPFRQNEQVVFVRHNPQFSIHKMAWHLLELLLVSYPLIHDSQVLEDEQ